uniref:Uncharacterized protein n=1 Tax=Rhizophora mucronata TaxID=61149 RepID=A0A2P2IL15_RHIMU
MQRVINRHEQSKEKEVRERRRKGRKIERKDGVTWGKCNFQFHYQYQYQYSKSCLLPNNITYQP